jgi:hypothetical protein
MGLFDFKNEIILNSSSIHESDIIQRKYVNEIVTITGRVKFESIVIEQSPNFGCYFEDTNAHIGVVDCCEALYSFIKQTKIRDYDGVITVKGKLVIPNTPRPMYQVMLERKSDIKFRH